MTDVSRRVVLTAGATTAAFAILEAAPTSALAATARPAAPLRTHFAGSVGKQFTATSGRTRHTVVLSAIHDLQPTTARNRPYCFTLVFTPVGRAWLPDGIYVLSRKGVPTHSLGLTSLGTGNAMQSVVNRPGNR